MADSAWIESMQEELHQDGENLDKMKEKGDECIFVGYSTQSRAYRVFNKRTRVIMESIHVNFDELPSKASVHNSTDPGPSCQTQALAHNSSDPAPTCQKKASVQISSDPAPECQTMALEHNSLSLGRNCQENVSHRDKTDGENLDKMKEKCDECIFVGYSNQSRAYRVFNKRIRVIMESIHVNFDELPQMASDQNNSDPAPECQTMVLNHDSLSPERKCQENVSHGDKTVATSNELDLMFSPMFDELLNGSSKVVSKSSAVSAADAPTQRHQYTNPLNNHTTPAPTCQNPSIATTVISSENINQANRMLKMIKLQMTSLSTYSQPRYKTKGRHSNHAGYLDTRKSTSGGIQFLRGDKLVSWSSKKQDCTLMSSVEAEYVSLSAPIANSCNPVQHSHTKHIDVIYHFIKEKVEKGIVELFFVRDEYQLADLFTKALPEDRFKYLVRRLGMRYLTSEELEVLTNESA
nr:copia protein [Tanacetum cinerariifolium]